MISRLKDRVRLDRMRHIRYSYTSLACYIPIELRRSPVATGYFQSMNFSYTLINKGFQHILGKKERGLLCKQDLKFTGVWN